jgi:hypothetical protein
MEISFLFSLDVQGAKEKIQYNSTLCPKLKIRFESSFILVPAFKEEFIKSRFVFG